MMRNFCVDQMRVLRKKLQKRRKIRKLMVENADIREKVVKMIATFSPMIYLTIKVEIVLAVAGVQVLISSIKNKQKENQNLII